MPLRFVWAAGSPLAPTRSPGPRRSSSAVRHGPPRGAAAGDRDSLGAESVGRWRSVVGAIAVLWGSCWSAGAALTPTILSDSTAASSTVTRAIAVGTTECAGSSFWAALLFGATSAFSRARAGAGATCKPRAITSQQKAQGLEIKICLTTNSSTNHAELVIQPSEGSSLLPVGKLHGAGRTT